MQHVFIPNNSTKLLYLLEEVSISRIARLVKGKSCLALLNKEADRPVLQSQLNLLPPVNFIEWGILYTFVKQHGGGGDFILHSL